jgi:transketolase
MNRHDSQRGYFAYALYQAMKENKDIWLVVGDLGYKVFDAHFRDFPDRCINTGAAEQAMMGIGIGLALEDKIPFVYSITPFLLYRAFEMIRNYIDHEKIPVKLIGSGRDRDYLHDGFSHWAEEDKIILKKIFTNIQGGWPQEKEDIPGIVKQMIRNKKPYYINLRK